jgi:hypothetical protein
MRLENRDFFKNYQKLKERIIMSQRLVRHFCMLAALTALGMGFSSSPVIATQGDLPDVERGVDVVTHGPIHEAFAETLAFDPEPGIVVPKAPPDAITEVPPEQKPEGQVEWVPGYWGWDDDRNDFIWVSGIWRVLPPGRQWVPGYWVKAESGFQWISGYWAPIKGSEPEYLPEPPESVEVGPNTSAPSPDYGWIPGCWIWYHGRYAWRPGYWAQMQPDWVWVPAHYVWTPRGYIFVGGYWDYAVIHRGVLFAPVFFSFGVNVGHRFSFTPSFVIDLNVFSDCLFLRPRYGHYYFGDYYASRYYQGGIYPWFSLHARRVAYEPIYAHQRWEHRKDREWEDHLQTRFQERRVHEESRPPRRLEFTGEQKKNGNKSMGASRAVAVPFDLVTKSKDSAFRFKPLNEKERTQIDQREKDVRDYRMERQAREAKRSDKRTERSAEGVAPAKPRFPRSPITAKPADQLDKKTAPPNRYKAPKPNLNVEPLQRTSDVPPARNRGQSPDVSQGRNKGQRPDVSRGGNKGQKSDDRGRKADDRGRRSGSRSSDGSGDRPR